MTIAPFFGGYLLYNTGEQKYYNGEIAHQSFNKRHPDGRTVSGSYSYTYDANCNLKTRVNNANNARNITAVTYNYLNLPQSVTAQGATVTYVYDASGRKLRSTNGVMGQTRDYVVSWSSLFLRISPITG